MHSISRPLGDRRPAPRPWLTSLVGFIAVVIFSILGGAPASAHTGFDSSQPAEGDVVDEPVELVTVVFTGEATPVGDGFVARDPDGNVRTPVSVSTIDNKVFSLRFDPPLAGGQIGIRWNVKAADAHPIDGAFAFSVTAPAIIEPATTQPATTEPAATEPAATATPSSAPAAAAVGADDATPAAPTDATATDQQATTAEQSVVSLEEFLATDAAPPGDTAATAGRLVGFLGVVLGLGVLAFAATTLRGSRAEVGRTLLAVRALGVVIVVGSLIEYVGTTRLTGDSLGSAWSSSPGLATTLRIVGGLALALGLAATVRSASAPRPLSAAVIDAPVSQPVQHRRPDDFRWVPDARSWPALVGAVLIIVSFWFDGHTVSKGVRPLHALVNTVHVVAGSVWVGGVVALAVLVWARTRAGRPTRAAELVVRFSTIATIALGAVVLAGAIMAVLVLDSFGDLTGTEWGQTLLLKTSAVGLAMIAGAYNHFRLLPALRADPDAPELQAELRSTVTAEAIMLVFVVIVTAWLVGAAI